MDFKRSDLVWEWLDKQKIGFSDRKVESGSGLSDRTVEKYKYDFHRMMNLVESMTGKTNPMQVKPNDVYAAVDQLIGEFKAGKTANASFLRGIDDALHAFKNASKASGVYNRELRLGDKRVISAKLNEEKVFRKASDSSVKPATREDMEKVVEQLKHSKSPARDVAIAVVRLEFETGKRISAILRSNAGDYHPGKDQYETRGDKGGKDNETYFLTPKAKEILDAATKGKKSGDMMFKIQYGANYKDQNKAGQDKSVESMRKQVSELIKVAAKNAGVNGSEKRYSSHSNRKGFGKERYAVYKAIPEAEARKELARRRGLDKQLDKRIDKVLDHIKSKFKNEKKAEKRDFTHEEVVRLLVSTDINHSRLDVMRYYLMDYDF